MPDPARHNITHKKLLFPMLGFLLLALLALLLLWNSHRTSTQAVAPVYPQIQFSGEYRIADGPWQQIQADKHIPATRGDVTLRGIFQLFSPDGEYIGPVDPTIPIAFYTDHISITVCQSGYEPHVMDTENPLLGPSACGQSWLSYALAPGDQAQVELLVHNPHRYGNDNAIDSLLENFQVWVNIDLERSVMTAGDIQTTLGILFLVVCLMLLGTALFSSLLHIRNSLLLWMFGLVTLFAGGYFIYSADGIFFRSQSVPSNTTLLGLCMMFYMLMLACIVTCILDKRQKLGIFTTGGLGLAVCAFILLPVVTQIRYYDTWAFWTLVQNAAGLILLYCLIRDAVTLQGSRRWILLGMGLPLLSFCADSVATGLGWWQGGVLSQYVFVLLFFLCLVMVLRFVPQSVIAATRAKEMEAEKKALDAELAQSRVSTMISQIRPHFIYNTLGSIEQLCELDPPKAGELVHNFSRYLRGNFGELDNPKPIPVSREIEHVKYYISIENIRFPDMTFTFEMGSTDFLLPALTIQPIVENAIKHGLMKLTKGGSIWVTSFETDTHYCVQVEDNGVGFDTGILLDERKHIGLRNIRGRLEAMVRGTLEIESTVGVGTKVLIKIPKEVQP